MSEPSVAELRSRLDGLTIRDAARLGRRLRNLRGGVPENLVEQFAAAEALVLTREAAVPAITYPDLPVSQHRDELAKAINDNQVVVVAGATGSGKTTQLPKICLELGRGIRGTIGHTQPRRLAARTVAQRIADELSTPLGEAVGYTVRFTDQASDSTLIKLMTDGILLAEIQRDRSLLRYDTLILDEAHERSLNIDFLIGYLRELLPRRPDLKVIVTSATIEPERFAAHFSDAPIVEVSGRTYPVEIRYRPLEVAVGADDAPDDPDDPDHEIVRTEVRDPTEAIVDAVRELESEPPGDVLVFLSGEREIRDTAEALKDLRNTEVLPLYARLPTADQQKVFQPSRSGRRIVLATNVAETSLTVPGIRYVVDPGTARISRYSRRTKVQRLPIEPISQASAAQRAGRSGRTAPGVCIRLYSEQDFESRPRYTDPEILRTNLAAVILQMAALQLGDIAEFPFLDPPDARSIRDGVQLLQELGAFDAAGALTDVGRRLARLPLDPRVGRMILQADTEGCVREVLVLAAALSIPDPRERPSDREEAARQKHARFADESSDFVSYLNLWNYLREQRNQLSGNAFRRMCREEFLHYLRIREWQDLTGQLRSIARDIGIRESDEPAEPASIHAALTAGLLSHVGLREGESRDYAGARNSKFVLAPGSVLTRKPPRWIVVADLVETSRLFGRIAAKAEPEAIERVAGHLVHRNYSEPHWEAKRGAVMAFERVTLYGLPLVPRRKIGYAQIEPELCRELFIRHALVEGDWQTRHHFFRDNARLRAELEEIEERARRRDLLAGDDDIYALYDARIPADIISARHFDAWWKTQRHKTPDLLTFTRDDLLRSEDGADNPDTWETGDLELPLTYRFEPGAADDGVTVHVPVGVLARLGGDGFAWQVPALREELVTALIKSLPKDLRRNFVPAPDTARAILGDINPSAESLLDEVQRELRRRSGILVPIDAFDLSKVPDHLRMTFAVESAEGKEVARGKDIDALREQLAVPVAQAVAAAVAGDLERSGLRTWPDDLDELPRSVENVSGGHTVRGYPAFVDCGKSVDIKVFANPAEQAAAMRPGLRRLLRLTAPSPAKAIERGLSTRTRLALNANPDGTLAALLEDCADAAADVLLRTPVWTKAEFAAVVDRAGKELGPTMQAAVSRVEKVLAAAHEVGVALPDKPSAAQADAVADIRSQLNRLLPKGFVTVTGIARLTDLARYVTAIARRLERLPQALGADRERMARVHAVEDAYDDLLAALSPARAEDPKVRDIAWQIEELRVSLWAQQLGTPRPVSEQRIYKAIDAVTR
ncbi:MULTISPECIES: ATP-dependent RNA helicase HrpA [unclassified Mycolicibacterium]|uniref:ATP-dependent RNA helicase HrpA n=1 Tax=unclassified Mycolicibacterium TaxID=2636767 RepID=UPI001306677B|nr:MULTISPECIES: ATP-dependent RNA helicase HrpA [unclassified Mycolicibacterium]MUL83054.1 ATP-dependent RNA helicase HrpA [Mycolicibacterium sp. CBMA 329]MUL89389.1 ATP-dependent RNA helicase HrpA [Mycolicibacterium sp. CBMA 331]MUM24704.1 ATP-dependent RNA helicase HrpA [Mycolicibacterium sp. CBMA 295]MUM38905.1 ATP-dependent RNA helicase HrpA [Mycolicibacterium sp. CBMA 247]MUM45453.1 ATP-dependent RNA helicase HrpA [Mycolicibacterium sp. CBMA 294]